MKKSIAIICTILPIPFTVFGAGQFYIGKKREGFLFLIAGFFIVYSSLLYLPGIDSLFGGNFLNYIAEANELNLIPPLITFGSWAGLISASIVRVGHHLE